MDPKIVIVITWVIAGLVVAAYVWFVVWRFRVERRRKEAEAHTDAELSDAIARTAAKLASTPPLPSSPTAAPPSSPEPIAASQDVPPPAPPRSDLASPSARSEATVAELVVGIALPHDLVPLTTVAPRPAVGDRVAFWTDRAPAEVVGPAFANELERLGYRVIPIDERSLSAQRDHDRLVVMIHPDGERAIIGDRLAFSTVPAQSVVVEVWVPA